MSDDRTPTLADVIYVGMPLVIRLGAAAAGILLLSAMSHLLVFSLNSSLIPTKPELDKTLENNGELKNVLNDMVRYEELKPEFIKPTKAQMAIKTGRVIVGDTILYVPKEVGALLEEGVFKFTTYDALAFIMGKFEPEGELFSYYVFDANNFDSPINKTTVTRENFEAQKDKIFQAIKEKKIVDNDTLKKGNEKTAYIEQMYTRKALWETPAPEVIKAEAESIEMPHKQR